MREIKFRAWNTVAEAWIENIVEQPLLFVLQSPPYINIMQYTGLKDKKGVEIYEGDIVVFKSWVGWELPANRFEVIFDNKQHGFCLEDRTVCGNIRVLPISDIEVQTRQFEVIGNIYENPELLDKEG